MVNFCLFIGLGFYFVQFDVLKMGKIIPIMGIILRS